jgi:hypothetical protein
MGEVKQYGGPRCATCGGRGILTDVNGRPHQCVPCSSERREESEREHGYSLECRGCEAVLTAADVAAGKETPRPRPWIVFGPLCGHCMTEATPPLLGLFEERGKIA